MNRLRRMCAVTIVTAVLTVSAFAGTLDSPGAPAPPPSEATSTSTTTTIILTILNLIR